MRQIQVRKRLSTSIAYETLMNPPPHAVYLHAQWADGTISPGVSGSFSAAGRSFAISVIIVSSLTACGGSSPAYAIVESSTTIAPVRRSRQKRNDASERENDSALSYGSSSSPKPECDVSAIAEAIEPGGCAR